MLAREFSLFSISRPYLSLRQNHVHYCMLFAFNEGNGLPSVVYWIQSIRETKLPNRSDECHNGGVQTDSGCGCTYYYDGDYCEIDKCANGEKTGDSTCVCNTGYSGEFCDSELFLFINFMFVITNALTLFEHTHTIL